MEGAYRPMRAHSQVESTPILSESRFKKLKEALARIAEKRGWLVSPAPSYFSAQK